HLSLVALTRFALPHMTRSSLSTLSLHDALPIYSVATGADSRRGSSGVREPKERNRAQSRPDGCSAAALKLQQIATNVECGRTNSGARKSRSHAARTGTRSQAGHV